MTLADIIRRKKAKAYLCPLCRRWHKIEEKNITDLRSEKEEAYILCSSYSGKIPWSSGITTIESEKSKFDDSVYSSFYTSANGCYHPEVNSYRFYINNDVLHFCARDRCEMRASIPLKDLDNNLFLVNVKPNKDLYTKEISATIEILFLIKCKSPCESCERSKTDAHNPCSNYEAGFARFMKGLQKDDCYTKFYAFGLRYNLSEEEIVNVPIVYNLFELKRIYSEMDKPDIRAEKNIRILENLESREKLAKFDGYMDRIKEMEGLVKRLKEISKQGKKNPEEEVENQACEYWYKMEKECIKILDFIQALNIVWNYRLEITITTLSDSIDQGRSLNQEIDGIESIILEFVRRFDENVRSIK